MNDFTKEELKCLHNALILQLRDVPMTETNAIRRSELAAKIQSMIGNYCEHESDGGLHTIVSFRAVVSKAICKCIKCSEYFLNDNQ